jgi:myo-inositol-1(or 4)-monophosphatase
VSIGLWENSQPVLGVIHDFLEARTYHGVVGQGAWDNNQPMRVSDVKHKANAVLATGFPSGRSYHSDSLGRFVQQVQEYKKLRLLGSAALSLAWVATGKLEAYHEEDIYFWDVAAGLALVQAAGGSYVVQRGSSQFQFNVFANNGLIK